MMSKSGTSFHEMPLLNQAACLIYLGRGSDARAIYEQVVRLYPESLLGEAGLKALVVGRDAS